MKRIISVISVLAMCLSLCSCKALDEMRANHAIYNENGNIECNGYEYYPVQGYDLYSYANATDIIHLTDADVPVLLSAFLSDTAYINEDRTIIEAYISNNYNDSYYCRSDLYDELMQQLNGEVAYEKYYYEYFNGDDYVERILTENEVQALNDALLYAVTAERILPTDYQYSEYAFAYISAKDKNGLFTAPVCGIYKGDGTFFLELTEADSWYFIEVPQEYHGIFDDIIEDAEWVYENYGFYG